jgi:hypothetical protein
MLWRGNSAWSIECESRAGEKSGASTITFYYVGVGTHIADFMYTDTSLISAYIDFPDTGVPLNIVDAVRRANVLHACVANLTMYFVDI